MTKKELWEKYKTKKDWYDEYCNCDICSNKVSYEIKIGGYYICEECFIEEEPQCEKHNCLLTCSMCMEEELNKVFIENKEPMNTSKEYIKKICDSAYEEDKEAIDEAIKYLGGK